MSADRLSPASILPFLAAACLIVLAGCDEQNERIEKEYNDIKKTNQLVDPTKNPRIEIEFDQPQVKVTVELLESNYPEAVNRFMALLGDGYYTPAKLLVEVPAADDQKKITAKSHLQLHCMTNVSASGYNGVFTNDATPRDGKGIQHLAPGKFSVPKVNDPRGYGMLVSLDADPMLDAKFIPIGVVLIGRENLVSITSESRVKEIKVLRYSRDAAQYILNKNELPPPPVTAAIQPKPLALIETDQGNIRVELDEDAAPNTVGNFIHLAEKGFYNNLTFHRVEDWVVQGGDPKGNGQGGPGYQFDNEINWDSLRLDQATRQQLTTEGFKSIPGLQSLSHDVGTLSMAHAGPGSNGSQFFIVRSRPAKFLDGKHTVFGKVLEGMDLVNGLKNGSPVKILAIKVLRKRPHKYVDGAHGPSFEPDLPVPTEANPAPAPTSTPTPTGTAPAPAPAPAPAGVAPAPVPAPAPAATPTN